LIYRNAQQKRRRQKARKLPLRKLTTCLRSVNFQRRQPMTRLMYVRFAPHWRSMRLLRDLFNQYDEDVGRATGAAETQEDFMSNLSRITQLTGTLLTWLYFTPHAGGLVCRFLGPYLCRGPRQDARLRYLAWYRFFFFTLFLLTRLTYHDCCRCPPCQPKFRHASKSLSGLCHARRPQDRRTALRLHHRPTRIPNDQSDHQSLLNRNRRHLR